MLQNSDISKETILSEFEDLLEDLSRLKKESSIDKIKEAFSYLINDKQEQVFTRSYVIFEAIKTARIAVNDIGLGSTSVISLFIYYSKSELSKDINAIKKKFGKDVAVVTNGLTSISGIENKAVSSQAENFRRLLLNIAKDVRVILIILAQQLESMRRLKFLPQDIQLRIASEASYLYAPLAHRLGLYLVKSEMEDISLKFTDQENYQMIARKLAETMNSRKKFIKKFIDPIEKALKKQGFVFEIKGRPKSIHSIWSKMNKKQVGFEDIYDLFAIRIILKSELNSEKADCWQVYSAVTDIYQPNPLRMRDWISIPKTNGYESLHTTVIGPDGKWVEVQIRTERMNEIAEKGVAAHWKYKGGDGEKGLDGWLSKIREILESPEKDADNFIDDFKLSLYAKEIFIFTPKGDLKKFPAGSTVLDFAYDIHTEVGESCTGAKVNGKVVPIRHKLLNGDKVEILTTKNQKPKLDWLNFVVTSRAQKKIRQKLNEEKVREAENGKELIKRRFKNWKVIYNEEIIRDLLKNYKLPNAQELYYRISTNKIDIANIKEFILKGKQGEESQLKEEELESLEPLKAIKDSELSECLIIDENVINVDYRLAKCCNPIRGDNVFGFVKINEGIKIHRTNCPNAVQLVGKYGYRIVSAKWTRKGPDSVFPVNIRVSGRENADILNSISEVISKDSGVTVRSINLENTEGEYSGIVGLVVRDLNHLDYIIKKLLATKGIYTATRIISKSL